MRKGLKILGLGVLVAVLAAGAFAAYVATNGIPRYAPGHLQIKVEVTPEKVDRGRKFAGLLCTTCHMDPTTRKLTGKRQADTPPEFGMFSKNITQDKDKGIGSWTDGELIYFLDFARAVREGVRPDKSVLLYPMEMMPELTEEDAGALYAYLKTVPKLRHAVARQQHPVRADASEGKKLYYKYGCISCHGPTGIGLADLRQAAQHYPNDKLLAAWIRNPGTFKPHTKMPTWEGVIAESEYPALIASVKELGKANRKARATPGGAFGASGGITAV